MKTKKLFFSALILLLMIGGTASAQIRIGLKGELGVNKLSADYKELFSTENINGFRVGPTFEIMLPVTDFGIDAAILYSNEKMNIKGFNASNLLDEVSNHYLDVPVNLKYKVGLFSPVKLFAAAGPYASIRLAGDEFKYNEIKDKVEAKSFQAGINLGVGAEVLRKVQVGVNYRIKLTDDYSVQEPDLKDAFNSKDGLWSITAAFFF